MTRACFSPATTGSFISLGLHVSALSLQRWHSTGLQHVLIRQCWCSRKQCLLCASCVLCVCAHRVYLSEHCALPEKQRLPGVHQDQIKVGLPGPVGGTSLWSIQTRHKLKTTHTDIKMFLQPSTAYLIQLWVIKREVKKIYTLPSGHGGSQTGRSWFSVRTQHRITVNPNAAVFRVNTAATAANRRNEPLSHHCNV